MTASPFDAQSTFKGVCDIEAERAATPMEAQTNGTVSHSMSAGGALAAYDSFIPGGYYSGSNDSKSGSSDADSACEAYDGTLRTNNNCHEDEESTFHRSVHDRCADDSTLESTQGCKVDGKSDANRYLEKYESFNADENDDVENFNYTEKTITNKKWQIDDSFLFDASVCVDNDISSDETSDSTNEIRDARKALTDKKTSSIDTKLSSPVARIATRKESTKTSSNFPVLVNRLDFVASSCGSNDDDDDEHFSFARTLSGKKITNRKKIKNLGALAFDKKNLHRNILSGTRSLSAKCFSESNKKLVDISSIIRSKSAKAAVEIHNALPCIPELRKENPKSDSKNIPSNLSQEKFYNKIDLSPEDAASADDLLHDKNESDDNSSGSSLIVRLPPLLENASPGGKVGADALGEDPGENAGEDAGEDALGEDALGEDALGEDALGEDALGENALGEDALGEDALGEDALGEDTLGEDAGEDALGEDALGEDALGEDAGDDAGEDACKGLARGEGLVADGGSKAAVQRRPPRERPPGRCENRRRQRLRPRGPERKAEASLAAAAAAAAEALSHSSWSSLSSSDEEEIAVLVKSPSRSRRLLRTASRLAGVSERAGRRWSDRPGSARRGAAAARAAAREAARAAARATEAGDDCERWRRKASWLSRCALCSGSDSEAELRLWRRRAARPALRSASPSPSPSPPASPLPWRSPSPQLSPGAARRVLEGATREERVRRARAEVHGARMARRQERGGGGEWSGVWTWEALTQQEPRALADACPVPPACPEERRRFRRALFAQAPPRGCKALAARIKRESERVAERTLARLERECAQQKATNAEECRSPTMLCSGSADATALQPNANNTICESELIQELRIEMRQRPKSIRLNSRDEKSKQNESRKVSKFLSVSQRTIDDEDMYTESMGESDCISYTSPNRYITRKIQPMSIVQHKNSKMKGTLSKTMSPRHIFKSIADLKRSMLELTKMEEDSSSEASLRTERTNAKFDDTRTIGKCSLVSQRIIKPALGYVPLMNEELSQMVRRLRVEAMDMRVLSPRSSDSEGSLRTTRSARTAAGAVGAGPGVARGRAPQRGRCARRGALARPARNPVPRATALRAAARRKAGSARRHQQQSSGAVTASGATARSKVKGGPLPASQRGPSAKVAGKAGAKAFNAEVANALEAFEDAESLGDETEDDQSASGKEYSGDEGGCGGGDGRGDKAAEIPRPSEHPARTEDSPSGVRAGRRAGGGEGAGAGASEGGEQLRLPPIAPGRAPRATLQRVRSIFEMELSSDERRPLVPSTLLRPVRPRSRFAPPPAPPSSRCALDLRPQQQHAAAPRPSPRLTPLADPPRAGLPHRPLRPVCRTKAAPPPLPAIGSRRSPPPLLRPRLLATSPPPPRPLPQAPAAAGEHLSHPERERKRRLLLRPPFR